MNLNDLDQIKAISKKLIQPINISANFQFQEKMKVFLKFPETKTFLIKMLDVAFRSKSVNKTADYIHWLFNSTNKYQPLFSRSETVLLRLFQMYGRHFPAISIPLLLKQIQSSTQTVVFFEGDYKFTELVEVRKSQGIVLNINLIGEAMIGEVQAIHRLNHYIRLLNQNNIDYVSVKMSTLFSQINPLAFNSNVTVLIERLSTLYRELLKIKKETGKTKFINIDMEEYRDLELNAQVFMQTLDQEEFLNLRAGIVMQAYLPDTEAVLERIRTWADHRVNNGGSPVKVRLVKGANLEMERTEASQKGWRIVTFLTKAQTDANFKRILSQLLTQSSCNSIHVGMASHNLFDISFTLHQVKTNNLWNQVEFELLEGMAPDIMIKLRKEGAKVIAYTPLVPRKDYNAAIAYLVRRLDEGTQKGNFLKEGFELIYPSETWEKLWKEFTISVENSSKKKKISHPIQNRCINDYNKQDNSKFNNEPDTNWKSKSNRNWIQFGLEQWKLGILPTPIVIPFVNGLTNNLNSTEIETITQKNYKGMTPWKYKLASEANISDFINTHNKWELTTVEDRIQIFYKVAQNLRRCRLDLMGMALLELGKPLEETDIEISEAVDFGVYYAKQLELINKNFSIENTAGINLVLSPWNFPIAIPLGGVFASLAVGKRVILKPSLNAAAIAYKACKCLWEAGIPKDVLAFLPSKEANYKKFMRHPCQFDAVILTGSTETAKLLLKINPELPLFAETGGKNSTYIESLSDHEQAISHVIDSAFSHSGQKCSATSLLILQEDLYESGDFKEKLKDAVKSIQVGNPWKLSSRWGKLSEPINSRIRTLLKNTPDSDWLIKPIIKDDYTLTPGVLWSVDSSDYFYKTEFFGPLLGVIKAKDVKEAVKISNGVDYGLTAGIESLNPPSIHYWKEHIEAGNLYINRTTTGAIVSRQPFGGIKQSCFGFGMKAGGPNYLFQFAKFKKHLSCSNLNSKELLEIKIDYDNVFKNEFNVQKDISNIRGQHNIFRYKSPNQVLLITDKATTRRYLQLIELACNSIGTKLIIFNLDEIKTSSSYVKEFDETVLTSTKIRSLVNNLPQVLKNYCNERAIFINSLVPHPSGRVELLNYFDEQSISHDFHRYGNLMGIKNGEF
jgi:RHH-type transcriptional regulator, proline utilization regulon repressor / proline dehydrogenase / delta 1-pyrroline-5-carboxylate dehydrogenase